VQKLQAAFRYIASGVSVSGEQVEVLVGHFVSECLICRPSLSIVRALYSFITDSYYKRQPLWTSCKREALMIVGVLPMLEAPLGQPWSQVATATDASPYGWGIVTRVLSPNIISDLGKWKENWRYKRLDPSEWAPRRRTSVTNDPYACITDPRTLGHPVLSHSTFELHPSELKWIEREGFPEVPESLLTEGWTTKRFGKFKYDEH
jgi:hypothetical protein